MIGGIPMFMGFFFFKWSYVWFVYLRMVINPSRFIWIYSAWCWLEHDSGWFFQKLGMEKSSQLTKSNLFRGNDALLSIQWLWRSDKRSVWGIRFIPIQWAAVCAYLEFPDHLVAKATMFMGWKERFMMIYIYIWLMIANLVQTTSTSMILGTYD